MTKFQIGDAVQVHRPKDAHERSILPQWVSEMDYCDGKVGFISDFTYRGFVKIQFEKIENNIKIMETWRFREEWITNKFYFLTERK